MGAPWRLFVAVTVPTELAETVAGFSSKALAGRSGWKPIQAGLLHFTLKFLGDTDSERIELIVAALREAAKVAPFELQLTGIGAFPHGPHPKILWIGSGAGSTELTALAIRVDIALATLGIPRERRSFVPHLTVARNKHGGKARDLPPHAPQLPSCSVRDLVLFRSELSAQGPTYTLLVTVPLMP